MENTTENTIERRIVRSAHNHSAWYIRFTPQRAATLPFEFFQLALALILNTLSFLQRSYHEWKIHPVIEVRFYKCDINSGEMIYIDQIFSLTSRTVADYNQEDVSVRLCELISQFISKGSGWLIDKVNWFDMRVCHYNSIRHRAGHGGSFDLPAKLKLKKAVVNVQNTGSDCFR